jgi:hypothetical protein
MRKRTALLAFASGLALAGASDAKEKHMDHFYAEIISIPHSLQDYETVGNWRVRHLDGAFRLLVEVSEMSSPDYEFLVGLHELVEAYLCKHAGIIEAAVTAFDVQFDKDRGTEAEWAYDEPGDAPEAPYHRQHVFASKIERMVADELGVDWARYEHEIGRLSK